MRRVPLAGRDKLFVLSRARDTEIHRESGTMSPSAARRIYIPRRISRAFYFSTENQRARVFIISQGNYRKDNNRNRKSEKKKDVYVFSSIRSRYFEI